jgi:hypothetical protein
MSGHARPSTFRRFWVPVALLIALGCDPHSASAPPGGVQHQPQETAALFANAATSAVSIVRSELDFSQFALWSQQLASVDGSIADRYGVDSAFVDATWNALYGGPLQDIEQALRQAIAANEPHQVGSLLILRAWAYANVTRMWGDAPFSGANQGDAGTIAPSYDKQSAIYDALLKDLAQSPQLMSAPGAGGFATNDPIYAGDATKWRRFASSLRARLGLDLLKADANRAKAEVIAAIAAGGFTSNDDDAEIKWPGDGTNDSPWSRRVGARADLRLSKTFIDTLISLSDPRLGIFAQPSSLGGQYAGVPNGLSATQGASYTDVSSAPGTDVLRKDTPSVLMSFAEFSFIDAEAAERGWISGSAKQFYEDGIRASLEKWGVAAADINTYLALPRVQYAGGNAGLDQIALQKWIALFTQGIDAWSEWRRTGEPALQPVATAQTSPAAIPRRLPYPRSEASLNTANLQAAITAQGGAGLGDHLWIDK